MQETQERQEQLTIHHNAFLFPVDFWSVPFRLPTNIGNPFPFSYFPNPILVFRHNPLKKSLFSFSKHIEDISQECPICFTYLDTKSAVKSTCQHLFHKECIEKWTKINNSCPVCRFE